MHYTQLLSACSALGCMAALASCAPVGTGASAELSDEEYFGERDALVTLVHAQGTDAALDRLRDGATTDERYARSCHALAHEVGRAALKRAGSFASAMKQQDEICNSGYLHGIIEDSFARAKDAATVLHQICREYSGTDFAAWQCHHGVGHGLMYFTQNDLTASLALCEKYPTAFRRDSCINGVFMENFNTDQTLHPSEFLDAENPLAPCEEQADRHKSDCYIYAPTHYLSLHPNAYKDALEWCADAEEGYGATCVVGVGSQAIKENILHPERVSSLCAGGADWMERPCVIGMTGLYMNHFGSLESGKELCNVLPASQQPHCEQAVTIGSSLFK